MARVASCPHCEHELLVPDNADAGALAKCPKCAAFFELKDAASRELPPVLLVEADVDASDPQLAPTVGDISTGATWTSDSDQNDTTSVSDEPDDEMLELEPSGQESPEAAAQRIDQWFRSAKTLGDVPDLEDHPSDESADRYPEPASPAGNRATVDVSEIHAGAGFDSDFELEQPPETPQDAATWDDSQHMDRLLAGLSDQPLDVFNKSGRKATPATHDDPMESADTWSPDDSMAIAPGLGGARRKRSIVRTLFVSVVGGVIGLALGYYALLWLRGPEIDFLELAKYLPQAALPPSFRSEATQLPDTRPSNVMDDLAASEKATDAKSTTTEPPAEKQAAFTAPAELPKGSSTTGDRYATPAAPPETTTHEPAVLDAPPAKALTETATSNNVVRITNAPSFTAADLTAALQAANDARPGLMNGDLGDGKDVQRTKGTSYSIMADLAQKATFVEASALPADSAKSNQEVDSLFRQTLSNVHTRTEVAQIVPKWIASPNRKHGGVFFAGNVTHQEHKGAVAECSVDLGGGQSLVVLTPLANTQQIDSPARRIGIIGWIVDKPAEQVNGYTGNAQRAVFAKEIISLE